MAGCAGIRPGVADARSVAAEWRLRRQRHRPVFVPVAATRHARSGGCQRPWLESLRPGRGAIARRRAVGAALPAKPGDRPAAVRHGPRAVAIRAPGAAGVGRRRIGQGMVAAAIADGGTGDGSDACGQRGDVGPHFCRPRQLHARLGLGALDLGAGGASLRPADGAAGTVGHGGARNADAGGPSAIDVPGAGGPRLRPAGPRRGRAGCTSGFRRASC